MTASIGSLHDASFPFLCAQSSRVVSLSASARIDQERKSSDTGRLLRDRIIARDVGDEEEVAKDCERLPKVAKHCGVGVDDACRR